MLAAGVAGYSRLMGADDEGTHERLTAHVRELADPKINGYRGRTGKDLLQHHLGQPWVIDGLAFRRR
jgi:hypothetical protein